MQRVRRRSGSAVQESTSGPARSDASLRAGRWGAPERPARHAATDVPCASASTRSTTFPARHGWLARRRDGGRAVPGRTCPREDGHAAYAPGRTACALAVRSPRTGCRVGSADSPARCPAAHGLAPCSAPVGLALAAQARLDPADEYAAERLPERADHRSGLRVGDDCGDAGHHHDRAENVHDRSDTHHVTSYLAGVRLPPRESAVVSIGRRNIAARMPIRIIIQSRPRITFLLSWSWWDGVFPTLRGTLGLSLSESHQEPHPTLTPTLTVRPARFSMISRTTAPSTRPPASHAVSTLPLGCRIPFAIVHPPYRNTDPAMATSFVMTVTVPATPHDPWISSLVPGSVSSQRSLFS